MGRQVNLDAPLSEVDKEYLRERGRGYLIHANERKFGVNGEDYDPETMGPGVHSPFYDSGERQRASYDVGGAPLPNSTLDYNTGRVADRDNGQLVEFSGPGHTPGAHDLSGVRGEPEGFSSYAIDENGHPVEEIDDDIIDEVLAIKSVKEIKTQLTKLKVDFPAGAKRDDLENALAIALQDQRDGNVPSPSEDDDESQETPSSENVEDEDSSGGGRHEASGDSPASE